MYKCVLLILIIFSAPSFAGSKCQTQWDSLKLVQQQLRHQSYEWLRDRERRKHKEYQACRKSKNNKSSKTKKHTTSKQSTYTQYKQLPSYRPYRSTISQVNVTGRFKGD